LNNYKQKYNYDNSFLYHALALFTLKYTSIEYKGNTIIIIKHVNTDISSAFL